MGAVERQTGLALTLGGSAALAAVMGSDDDMAVQVMEPIDLSICERCSTREFSIVSLLEDLQEQESG